MKKGGIVPLNHLQSRLNRLALLATLPARQSGPFSRHVRRYSARE